MSSITTGARARDDGTPISRIGKHSGRRLHSDVGMMGVNYTRHPAPAPAPVAEVRRSCFWETVMDTVPARKPPRKLPPASPVSQNSSPSSHGSKRAPQASYLPHASHPALPRPAVRPLERGSRAPRPVGLPVVHRCGDCGAMFRGASELRTHRHAKHSRPARPYHCTICAAQFSQRSHLNQHVRTVHDKHKPFVCDGCGKPFGKRFDLNAHIDAVHKLERPHICSHCSVQFAKRSNLKRHFEKLHPGIPFIRR